MGTLRFGRYTVETSREDKVFFPDDGLTKGDLIGYYRALAATMLPHLRDRPLSMLRFPEGIDGKQFFHKDAPDYFPDWITTARLPKADGTVRYVVADRAATLAYLANQACITPHVMLSRADRPDHPDRLVWDLDPPDGGGHFDLVRVAALHLRERLTALGLVPYVQTTGSRGLHVVCPLDRSADFDTARTFAQRLAAAMAAVAPDRYTTAQAKAERGGRLYLDTGRNAYAQTMVAPYAVRARPGAPVATPLDWAEVRDSGLRPDGWTLRSIPRRLGQKADPWRGMGRHARALAGPWQRLRRETDAADGH